MRRLRALPCGASRSRQSGRKGHLGRRPRRPCSCRLLIASLRGCSFARDRKRRDFPPWSALSHVSSPAFIPRAQGAPVRARGRTACRLVTLFGGAPRRLGHHQADLDISISLSNCSRRHPSMLLLDSPFAPRDDASRGTSSAHSAASPLSLATSSSAGPKRMRVKAVRRRSSTRLSGRRASGGSRSCSASRTARAVIGARYGEYGLLAELLVARVHD